MRLAAPTNLGNLLAMWGLGALAPAEALPKYYPDPSEHLGGRLPVVDVSEGYAFQPADSEAIEAPVLVELKPAASKLVGPGPFPGLLPVNLVDRVHVSDRDRIEEVLARPYRDVDPAAIPWQASPELFHDGGQLDLGPSDDDASTGVSTDLVAGVERALGAVTLMLTAAPADLGVARLVADVFAAAQEADGPPLPDLAAFATGDPEAEAWLLERVLVSLASGPTKGVPDGPSMLAGLSEGAPDVAAASIDYMARVLRFEVEFNGFPEGEGLSSARALLLFLLRPEPDEVATWAAEEVNAGPKALALAAAFAGLRAGYRRLPLSLRGSPLLRDRCGQILASRVNAVTTPATKPFGRVVKSRPTLSEAVASRSVVFKSGNRIVAKREIPKPSPRHRLVAGEWGPEEVDEARRIAIGLRWNDALRTLVATKDLDLPASVAAWDGGGHGMVPVLYARGWSPPDVDRDRFVDRLETATDAQLFRALDKVPANLF